MLSYVIIAAIINANLAYIIKHYDVAEMDVEVHVRYDSDCSSKIDFSTIITVPRGSSILNVLERANQNYPTFTSFKVAFIGASTGAYQVVCINGDCAEDTCVWVVTTDPVTSSSVPINDKFVSNIGMIVHFTYTDNVNLEINSVNSTSGTPSGPEGVLNYDVEYGESCQPAGRTAKPSVPYAVSYILGESALNIMERAAIIEPIHNYVLTNLFGRFYIIDTFADEPTTGNCMWCVYYSPSTVDPPYHITADINNFVIPIPLGSLTLKYENTCGNAVLDALNHHKIKNVPLPIPPHFNPFMYMSKTK
jgi:hypothetical protein